MPGSDFFMETLCAKGIAHKSYSYVRNNHPNYPNKALGTSANTVFHTPITKYVMNIQMKQIGDSIVLADQYGNIIDQNTVIGIANWYRKNSTSDTSILSTLGNINTGAGMIASGAEMINKNLILGPKYLKINNGGTLVRNHNRNYTSVKNIAKSTGNKILLVSYLIDLISIFAKEKSPVEAGANMAASTVIYAIGSVCPPAGIVVGLMYLSITLEGRPEGPIETNYEKIHGTITPGDKIKVVNQQKFPIIKSEKYPYR